MSEAFVGYSLHRFHDLFPGAKPAFAATLEEAAQHALDNLLRCDCPYHDAEHTLLVTDIGQTMLRGWQAKHRNLTPEDWMHAVIAMLYHDIGYIRGLLSDDDDGSYVIDEKANRVIPPPGCTDAFMTPYHVDRGALYVRAVFANNRLVDEREVARLIAATRFPIPKQAPPLTDPLASIVRAADLLGQMADPLYLQKLSRLYAEFQETGEAARQGFKNAQALRENFPEFYHSQVAPHVAQGMSCLEETVDGEHWLRNLQNHLAASGSAATRSAPTGSPETVARLA